jgi:phage terminase small subunit
VTKKRRRPKKPKATAAAIMPVVTVVEAGAPALTEAQETFALTYIANGYNATAAYRDTHPAVSPGAARVEAHRLITKPNIWAFIEQEKKTRFDRLRMGPDEALGLISMVGRADPLDLFDKETGKLLPIHKMPLEIRLCIRSIKPGEHGDTITLLDALKARELMAIAGGRLRQAVDLNVSFDHVKYLASKTPEAEK